jgi:hypothetical protein
MTSSLDTKFEDWEAKISPQEGRAKCFAYQKLQAKNECEQI